MTKRYWQILMAQEDQEKTAFGTPWGLFEFQKMPFKHHGDAATFQHLVNQVLSPHQNYAAAYINGVIIFSTQLDTTPEAPEGVNMGFENNWTNNQTK